MKITLFQKEFLMDGTVRDVSPEKTPKNGIQFLQTLLRIVYGKKDATSNNWHKAGY